MPLELISKILWSEDFNTQVSIGVVLGFAAFVILFIYVRLWLLLFRVISLRRKLNALVRDSTPEVGVQDRVKEALNSSPLRDHGNEFFARWNNSKGGIEQGSPVRFSSTFVDRPLLRTGFATAMLPSIPGIFLALGILGTFAGLTLALADTGNSSEEISTQIDTLVASLSLAFRTSLWGILLSVLFVFLSRHLDGSFEKEEETIDLKIHEVFPWVSNSELTANALKAQREGTHELKNALQDVAMSLENAITAGLEKIEKTSSAAANLVSQELIEQLGQTLQEGVGAHVDALRSAIEETTRTQAEIGESLALAFEEIRKATSAQSETADKLNLAASVVGRTANQLATSAQDFAPVVRNLSNAGESLSSTSSAMARIQEQSTKAVVSVRESLEQAQQSLDQQRDLVEGALNEMRSSMESLSEGLSDDLTGALKQIDGILSGALGQLNGTILDSNETIGRMGPAVAEVLSMTKLLHSSFESMGGDFKEVGSGLTAGLVDFSGYVAELSNANKTLARKLEDIEHGLGQSTAILKGIRARSDSEKEQSEKAPKPTTGGHKKPTAPAIIYKDKPRPVAKPQQKSDSSPEESKENSKKSKRWWQR